MRTIAFALVAIVLLDPVAAAGQRVPSTRAAGRSVTPRGPLPRVRFSDGRDVDASLVGVSPAHDLAVLKVTLDRMPPPLPLGHDLRVGQTTFAIGNPFGLDFTLTTGIVSALDCALPAEDGRSRIGVNTAIFSPSGASSGVGFAIPADTVNRVVPQLIARGRYIRAGLGVQIDDQLNQLITRRLGVTGVVILRAPVGSAAEAAGLRGVRPQSDGSVLAGDVIVAVDGQPVDSVPRLTSRLDDHEVGDTVTLIVLRDDARRDVRVRLQAETP